MLERELSVEVGGITGSEWVGMREPHFSFLRTLVRKCRLVSLSLSPPFQKELGRKQIFNATNTFLHGTNPGSNITPRNKYNRSTAMYTTKTDWNLI